MPARAGLRSGSWGEAGMSGETSCVLPPAAPQWPVSAAACSGPASDPATQASPSRCRARTIRCAGRSFADNEPIQSGLPPEDGVLQIYNWVAYINQAVVDGFAKKYHVPTPQVTTFNTMSEAIAKLADRRARLRHLLPDDRRPRAARGGKAPPPAEPLLHPEHQPGVARLPEPVLRPRLAVHGPVHDLHDRHVVAEGPRRRGPLHDGQPLGHALEREVPREGRHPRRLSRGHLPRSPQTGDLRPQHDTTSARSTPPTTSSRTCRTSWTCRSTTTTTARFPPGRRGSTMPGPATWRPHGNTYRHTYLPTSSATGSLPMAEGPSPTT